VGDIGPGNLPHDSQGRHNCGNDQESGEILHGECGGRAGNACPQKSGVERILLA
jgi:hypothetical protein